MGKTAIILHDKLYSGNPPIFATYELLGKPIALWVQDSLNAAKFDDTFIICAGEDIGFAKLFEANKNFLVMDEKNDIVSCLQKVFSATKAKGESELYIAFSDAALMSADTITNAHNIHKEHGHKGTILSTKESGVVGVWFDVQALEQLVSLTDKKLTNVREALRFAYESMIEAGQSTSIITVREQGEGLRPTNPISLLEMTRQAIGRVLTKHMMNGVIISNDDGVMIGPDVEIGAGTTIHQGTSIIGKSKVGHGCNIGPTSRIENCEIGNNVTINASQAYQSKIGDSVRIGPFSHIRPNCHIYSDVKIGNFVEIKNSVVDCKTSIAHLTYIGDSDIGAKVNIGCGVVTVNYNGASKFRTIVENGAFVGCNTNLIAPVIVGESAYVAAGSTITDNVPSESLAIARTRQIIKEDWNLKK